MSTTDEHTDTRPDMPTVTSYGTQVRIRRRNPIAQIIEEASGTRTVGHIDAIDMPKTLAWIRGALHDAYAAGVIDGRTAAQDPDVVLELSGARHVISTLPVGRCRRCRENLVAVAWPDEDGVTYFVSGGGSSICRIGGGPHVPIPLCPRGHGELSYYTLGAPGVGGGWSCDTCGHDEPDAGNRILTPEETI